MRVLADENISASVIRELRKRGHDVLSVVETMQGASDPQILKHAESEERIVVTHDHDFGELAYRSRLPAASGVILLRSKAAFKKADIDRLLQTLESRADWTGHFSVITDERIRMRPLPPARRQKE